MGDGALWRFERHEAGVEEKRMSNVKPIPDGYRSVTPYLTVRGAADALAFYGRAFGAEERFRMPGPDGSVMHAELQLGDSIVMLSEEALLLGLVSPASLGGTSTAMHLYVSDVDASFARAVQAGCEVEFPPTDMFWGDRFARVRDPFGHKWGIATHKEDLSPEQMMARMQAM
jgi:uncharacterized glyoxalase superfamily protein PhnB